MSGYIARLATRTSPLALFQANLIGSRLIAASAASSYVLVPVETKGDRSSTIPISELSGQGVFTTDVEQTVLEGNADIAVHSAKDLPSSNLPEGLVLGAVPVRADARDALVGRALLDLAPKAIIATGSVRRRVQMMAIRPDLEFVGLRGNIATRLTKIPDTGAAVFAYAALERLGLLSHVAEVLSVEQMLPQVGQGAIALRCRADDDHCREVLGMIDDVSVHRAVRAERAYLARLGGGCDAPVGAYAITEGEGEIILEALLASEDATTIIRASLTGNDPELLGTRLADQLLAEHAQRRDA